jgi:hypothetical protein
MSAGDRLRTVFQALSSFSQTVLIIAAVGGLALAAFPFRPAMFRIEGNLRRQLFPRPSYVTILKPDRRVKNLVDQDKSSVWSPDTPPPHVLAGFGAAIRFDPPVRLYKVGVLTGVASNGNFRNSSRAHRLQLTASASGGATKTIIIDLKDSPEFQSFSFKTKGKVNDVKGAVTGCNGPARDHKDCSIREVEFFARS